MAFVFECSHGTVSEDSPARPVSHAQILDMQLTLYEEVVGFALGNQLPWTLPQGPGR